MTISIDQLRISYKNPCRIATTANINLATTGLTAIDGITPVEEDRVLVKDQSTGSENGIYIAKAGAWVRSKDFDVSSNDNIVGQVEVRIQEGATNGGKRFVLTNTGTITIGSTSLVFSESSALSDHAALLNLAWTGSNHTGTANHIPFFDGSGAPSTSDDLIWDGSDLGVTGTVTINSTGTSLTLEPGAANARRISLGNQTGGGPPQFSSYSSGMRILLFDNVNAGNVGYGFGMDGAHIWSAVSQNTNGWAFDWFAGTDRLATIYALGDGLELLETNSLTAGTTAGYGRFWIKDDAPNVAYFTDDASNNWELAKETDDVTFSSVDVTNVNQGILYPSDTTFENKRISTLIYGGASSAGNWYRFAKVTIDAQFEAANILGRVYVDRGTSVGQQFVTEFQFRAQQQSSYPSGTPNVTFTISKIIGANSGWVFGSPIIIEYDYSGGSGPKIFQFYAYTNNNFARINFDAMFYGSATIELDEAAGSPAILTGSQVDDTAGNVSFPIGYFRDMVQIITSSASSTVQPNFGGIWVKSTEEVPYYTNDSQTDFEIALHGTDVTFNDGTFNNVTGSNFRVTGVIETDAIPRIEPVYIRGTGNNNPGNRIVRVGNTTHVNVGGRGLTLTVLTASDHSLVSTTNYDTFGFDSQNTDLASALDDLTRDQIGILTSVDAWERNVTEQKVTLSNAARRLGLFRLANYQHPSSAVRRPYAAIFRGAGTGTSNVETFQEVIEVMHDTTGSIDHAQIVTWMVDGTFIHTPPVQELVGRPENGGRLRVFGNDYIESDLSIQLTASSLTSDPTTSRRIMFDDDTSTVVAATDTGGNPDLAYRVNAASHTFFDQTTSLVDISSAGVTSSINIVPDTDDALDLGSTTLSWANLYLASKIHYKSDLEFVSASNRLIRFGNTGSIDVQNHGINTPFGGLGKLENLIDYSEDLTPGTGNWTTPTVGSSITANAATAPDGEVTADLFEVAAGSASGSYNHRNSAGLGGTTYTLFFWAKKGTGDFVLRVDIGDGTSSGNITLTDEWVRYRKVLANGDPPGTGAGHVDFLISGHDSGTASQVYLWGAQVCAGDVDYPYYPTYGATKTLTKGALSYGDHHVSGNIYFPNNPNYSGIFWDVTGSTKAEVTEYTSPGKGSAFYIGHSEGRIELFAKNYLNKFLDTGGLSLQETTETPNPSGGEGVYWVSGTSPNTPYFTDDTDTTFKVSYYFGAWAGEDSTGLGGYTSTANIDFGTGRVEDVGPNGLSWDSVNKWLDLTDAGVYELSISALFSKAAGSNTIITITVDWWDGGAWNIIYNQSVTVLAGSTSPWSYTTLADVTAASGRIRVRTSATNAANLSIADMRVKRIE